MRKTFSNIWHLIEIIENYKNICYCIYVYMYKRKNKLYVIILNLLV